MLIPFFFANMYIAIRSDAHVMATIFFVNELGFHHLASFLHIDQNSDVAFGDAVHTMRADIGRTFIGGMGNSQTVTLRN